MEKGDWRRVGGNWWMEKGSWRRVGGEGWVEKSTWRRVGEVASSYSPALHCCYFVVAADCFLAIRIAVHYVMRHNKMRAFYINVLM